MNALLKIPSLSQTEVILTPAEVEKRDKAIELSKAVTKVTSPEENELAVTHYKKLNEICKDAEADCDTKKTPFYKIYKMVMDMTSAFILPAKNERDRVKKLIDIFAQQQEQARLETERKQQEALRLAEQKQADALAEQERLAQQARQSAKKEIAVETKVQEAADEVRQIQTTLPPVVATAAGQKNRMVDKWEITDAAALYAVRPEFFDLVEKKSLINSTVNANPEKAKLLPGLRVWKAVDSKIR
jgi:hypothetical protein